MDILQRVARIFSRAKTPLLMAYVTVLLVAPLWIVRYPPLLDYPDHLARSFILVHFREPGYHFSSIYSVTWGPYPYLGMDLLLMGLQHLFAAELAGRILLSVTVLALPASAWWFLRHANPGHDWLATWALLPAYDAFFLEGFVNFQLALALSFVALTEWLRWQARPGFLRWLGVLVLATCTYFTHLMAFGITGFVVIIYMLAQRCPARRILLSLALFVPGTALLYQSHIGTMSGHLVGFRSLPGKLFAIRAELLHGYSMWLEVIAFWMIGLSIILAIVRNHELHWNVCWAWVFAATLALYLALPRTVQYVFTDVRLVPSLFVLLLTVVRIGRRQMLVAVIAVLIMSAYVADIARNFVAEQRDLRPMSQAIDLLSPGARMLPIIAIGEEDMPHQLYAHFWAYAVIERGVVAPGLFSMRGQMPLAQNDAVYVPDDSDDPERVPPDWEQVRANYDYLWSYNVDFGGSLPSAEIYHSGPLHLYNLH